VVREEEDGVRLYSHVGTVIYHSETAKGYVDLGLLTADRDIGQDLAKVFHFFTGPTLDESFSKLLIAPVTMRSAFRRAIRREARHAQEGRPARIVVKVNGLEDPTIVEELYRASMAGVEIDLIVRDICRLRPGLEDVSETISVVSLVGRFLEHSRIFYFENGGDPEYYLGSADWMTRNLDNRVEAVVPVEDTAVRRQLKFVLELNLADNRRVWEMESDGTYRQRRPADGQDPIDTQAVLMDVIERGVSRDDAVVGMPGPYPVDGELLVGDPAIDSGVDRASASGDEGGLPPTLLAHPDRWYVPDSDHYDFAIETPDGGRQYRKTAAGAASVLDRCYGGSDDGAGVQSDVPSVADRPRMADRTD
jgi:polyphosphate kinase